jgi:hypothetical protein
VVQTGPGAASGRSVVSFEGFAWSGSPVSASWGLSPTIHRCSGLALAAAGRALANALCPFIAFVSFAQDPRRPGEVPEFVHPGGDTW